MKSKTSTAAQYGLAHIEMAMLLLISRSLWSMYEGGQRNLPTEAHKLLSLMDKQLRVTEGVAKNRPDWTIEDLQKRLGDNDFQIQKLTRSRDALQAQVEKKRKRASLAEFFSNRESTAKNPNFSKFLERSVKEYERDQSTSDKYALDIRLLEVEREWLEREIRDLGFKI